MQLAMTMELGNDRIRKGINGFVFFLTIACTVLTLVLLSTLLGTILYWGLPSLRWDFFTNLPTPAGEGGGGMANACMGTVMLIAIAAAIAFPTGFFGGIYLSEFGSRTRQAERIAYCVRYAADLLNGIPSIVIGIFSYVMIVVPMKQFSTLAGGVALSIILIPLVLKNTEEFLRLVPATLREAGLALGMAEWRMILTVVVPTAFRGILTGMMLGVARVSGETAPLLFTAFGNHYWSEGILEPTASLPVMIYTYSTSPYSDWQQQAWTAGVVLLLMVLLTNIISRWILQRGAAR
jgi:phosphate transport system permease protein